MPTVISRPGRKLSTSTGWRKASISSAQAPGQLEAAAQPLRLVAEAGEAGGEGRDGLLLVELHDRFGGEPRGEVVPLQVVAEADAERSHAGSLFRSHVSARRLRRCTSG